MGVVVCWVFMATKPRGLIDDIRLLATTIEEQKDTTDLYKVLQQVSGQELDQSPLILEFISRDNWRFIRLLHSVISSIDEKKTKTKILSIQILISLGEQFPPIWTALGKDCSLIVWVFNDIQSSNEEVIFYALEFFNHLLDNPLPAECIGKFGYNLIDYLLDLIVYRDEEGDGISAKSLECLVFFFFFSYFFLFT